MPLWATILLAVLGSSGVSTVIVAAETLPTVVSDKSQAFDPTKNYVKG